ncbi:MAG TPA: transglutaminase-like domain-containing protein [Capsulimonadaceae bacterium]|jgi:regulator of sirC expression with transglutaminase-like and TPR domain
MAVSTTVIQSTAFEMMAHDLDEQTDLARPALLIALDEYPGLDIDASLAVLDELADAALDAAIIDASSEFEAAVRLSQFLCDTCAFHGNTDNYYDPANSYFNRVLDRRIGIPITLSLVLIEVGQRLGLPLSGVGIPGHFLVSCPNPFKDDVPGALIDMFSGGIVVSHDDCRKRCAELGQPFNPETHLQPIGSKQLLVRMLANLRMIYTNQGDIERTLRTICRMAILDRDQAEAYRELGSILAEDGRYSDAQRCLRAFLECCPVGESADAARSTLSMLLDRRARRN